MAQSVERAIRTQSHLIVEAGTGVGKSFAYLVPAILALAEAQSKTAKESPAARRDDDDDDDGGPNSVPFSAAAKKDKRRRVVISTHTIALQEQIFTRDIPFLKAVLPVEFSTVLVKGRSNYISLRRMKLALERGPILFGDPQESEQLHNLASGHRRRPKEACRIWHSNRSAPCGTKSSVMATTAWARNVRPSKTATTSRLAAESGTLTSSSSITRCSSRTSPCAAREGTSCQITTLRCSTRPTRSKRLPAIIWDSRSAADRSTTNSTNSGTIAR